MRYLSISPRLLLPLIILMGLLIIGMRVEDLWSAAADGHLFSPTALAETKANAPAAPAKATEPAAPTAQAPAAAPPAAPQSADAGTLPTPDAAAPEPDEDRSPAEVEVLKQLSSRRETLDRRAHELDSREALIKVGEQRVDQKIREMESLRAQLQSMVNQVSESQQQQLENLVKIYETMKPDQAAKIFETLDMPTLLNVVLRMKPKSTAPIMAQMAPEKAKELTVALTKQDQLPQVK